MNTWPCEAKKTTHICYGIIKRTSSKFTHSDFIMTNNGHVRKVTMLADKRKMAGMCVKCTIIKHL